MSNEYTPQHISPEQLARVISIIEEQKEKELQEPTLCGACGQYYEKNEQGDDGYHAPELCDANDEIKTRSIFIEGRLWFDKINGNTYFSNRVWVNGKIAFVMPFEYGYDLQFLHRALDELKDRGYTNTATMWELRDEQKIDVYYSDSYGKKSEMFKESN